MTTAARVPAAEYYASRPKAMVGAGAVYYTADGRFLLVKTSYDSQLWELLGGGMEPGEFPLDIATREIKETRRASR
jgi:8-oxo-dGTP diphosphatase